MQDEQDTSLRCIWWLCTTHRHHVSHAEASLLSDIGIIYMATLVILHRHHASHTLEPYPSCIGTRPILHTHPIYPTYASCLLYIGTLFDLHGILCHTRLQFSQCGLNKLICKQNVFNHHAQTVKCSNFKFYLYPNRCTCFYL